MAMRNLNKTTRMRIAECVKIRTTIQKIREQFNVTEGNVMDVLQELGMYGTPEVVIGKKDEAYFEGDFPPEKLNYSVEELSGEEKKIFEQSSGENGSAYRFLMSYL